MSRLRIRPLGFALLCLLLGSSIAAVVIWFQMPSPPGTPHVVPLIGGLTLLTLVGPFFYAWAAGPHPLSTLEGIAALAVPTLAIATMVFGYLRERSRVALVAATALWCAFGGYAAYLAVMGTV